MGRGLTGSESFKCGQIWKWHSFQEYGSAAVLWATAGSEFHIYDALTGAWMANITNAVTGASFIQDFSDATMEQGTIYAWYTSSNTTGTYLNMWNSTRCIAYSNPNNFGTQKATPGSGNWPRAGAPQVEMNYRVTPSGSLNWTCGIQYWTQINTTLNGAPVALSSVTYTFSDLGKNTKKILLLRSSGTVAAQSSNGYQLCEGIDALTGNVLWGPFNQTIPKYHDIGFVGARNGTYVLRDKDTMEAYGYSLETGLQKWGPVKLPANAWSYLATSGWLDNSRAYVIDYGGYVNALNLATGNIDWTWHTDDAGYNTPYGVYELWVQGQMAEVAGLIYVFEGKLYDPPMSANESIICLNATTESWSGADWVMTLKTFLLLQTATWWIIIATTSRCTLTAKVQPQLLLQSKTTLQRLGTKWW
jgi:hypothetical protein